MKKLSIQLFLILTPILLNIAGEIILKANVTNLELSTNILTACITIMSSTGTLFGIFLILLGSVLWLVALSRYQLSYLYPFMALNYIGIIAGAGLFLQETISTKLYVATALLCIGLLLISKSKAKECNDTHVIQKKDLKQKLKKQAKTLKKTSITVFLIGLILLQSGCRTTNPITGEKNFNTVSEDQEARLGKRYHQVLVKQMGQMPDSSLNATLNNMGAHILKQLPDKRFDYTFTITDTPMINAFAVPGGYIYITRGILSYFNTEDEMAAVVGHEITHVAAKHTAQRISQSQISSLFNLGVLLATKNRAALEASSALSGALLAGYGRENELESDQFGLDLSYKAGYHPEGALSFMKTLHRKSKSQGALFSTLFASHPPANDRIKKIESQLTTLNYTPINKGSLLKKRGRYLKKIEGIILGSAPRHGYFSRDYYNNLCFNMMIPLESNWKLSLSKQNPYLNMVHTYHYSKGKLYMFTPREAKQSFLLSDLSKRSFQKKTIAGIKTKRYFQDLTGKRKVSYVFKKNNRHYVAEFIGATSMVEKYASTFLKNIEFQDPKEAKTFGVGLLELYKTKPSDTYRHLSKQFYNTVEYATNLAAFNGQDTNDKPYPLIKIFLPERKKLKTRKEA